MNFLQQLRLGFRSLLLHKLRSALAVLGIIIGVTAVIWLVATLLTLARLLVLLLLSRSVNPALS